MTSRTTDYDYGSAQIMVDDCEGRLVRCLRFTCTYFRNSDVITSGYSIVNSSSADPLGFRLRLSQLGLQLCDFSFQFTHSLPSLNFNADVFLDTDEVGELIGIVEHRGYR